MEQEYIPEPFGPIYPNIPGAAKFRKIPKAELTAEQKRAYSDVIESTIKRLQKAQMHQGNPAVPETIDVEWHKNGPGRAIRAQQSRTLLNYPSMVRRNRTAEQWESMYSDAMALKAAQLGLTK